MKKKILSMALAAVTACSCVGVLGSCKGGNDAKRKRIDHSFL